MNKFKKIIFIVFMLGLGIMLNQSLSVTAGNCCSCSASTGYCFGASNIVWNSNTHTLTANVACFEDGPPFWSAIWCDTYLPPVVDQRALDFNPATSCIP